MLETVGNLFICLAILGGAIIFTWVNVMYTPDKEEESNDAKHR